MPEFPLKIIYMGTPEFALAPLEKLLKDEDFEVVAVVTQEDKKIGRKQEITAPLVKKLAEIHKIPVLQPEKIKGNEDFHKLIKGLEPDFIVVVAYGQILPSSILEIPKYGCINVHGSMLPRYRGASPVEECLLQGDKDTGITIMKMAEKLDSGDIFIIKKMPIEEEDNALSLRIKLSLLGAEFLPEVLRTIADGDLPAIAQNEAKATYCRKIKKEDGLVNFHELSAEEILRHIKAYTGWPSTYVVIEGKRLKILQAEMDSENIGAGKTKDIGKNKVGIGTKDGLLIPLIVQLEGKSPMRIEDFLLGNRGIFEKI